MEGVELDVESITVTGFLEERLRLIQVKAVLGARWRVPDVWLRHHAVELRAVATHDAVDDLVVIYGVGQSLTDLRIVERRFLCCSG